MKPTVRVQKLHKLNTLVIKQTGGRFFIAAPDSIVIDVPGLMMLLKFLVFCGYVDIKAFKGLVEEYDSVHSNT